MKIFIKKQAKQVKKENHGFRLGKSLNYKITSIAYVENDGKGDLVRIVIQSGLKVEQIYLSPYAVLDLGFINPDGLKDYLGIK
jgi:hypothetical protein